MGLQDKPSDPVAVASREASAHFYDDMERRLGKADYLAGSYSFADIAFYMAQLFGARMGAGMTDATPGLLAWRDRRRRPSRNATSRARCSRGCEAQPRQKAGLGADLPVPSPCGEG